jgi:hypothetical protein
LQAGSRIGGGERKRPRGTTLVNEGCFFLSLAVAAVCPSLLRGGEWRWGTHHCSLSPGIERQRLRVERRRWQSRGQEVEAGGVDATTSRQKRDDCGGGSGGNCDGDKKCRDSAITGFGNDNYDDACQRPLWWGQLAS